MSKFAVMGVLGLAVAAPLEMALADGIPTTPRPRPRVMQQEQPPAPPPVEPSAPPVVNVQPPPPPLSPWYAMISGGAAFPQNTDWSAGGFSGTINYGTGFHAFVGLGYRFTPWLSAEVEGGYLHLPVDSASLGGTSASIDGTVHGLGMFANAVLTWPEWTVIRPYIAGGPGFVHRFDSDFSATVGGTTVSGNIGSSTDFALQAKAGIDIRLSETVAIAPEYRYFWINSAGDGLENTNIHAVGASLKFRF